MEYLSHLPLFVYLPAYYYFLRKRPTTDRLARQQTQTTKFRDFSPISTREAISAPTVAKRSLRGNNWNLMNSISTEGWFLKRNDR